ncbi:MAG: class I SAM-dependent methyltransferase [Christensenellaceae bacterium]|jgi:ubiquinone/menaquinone biosynthesis C-methylase UbiE|nr:class I SAM-dependent methyltransferase [Christensenellaceae bacterium]
MGLQRIVAEQFGRPSGVLGNLSTFLMNRLNARMYASVEEEIASREEAVLDLGFGNGYLLRRLAKRADNRYYGVDISSDMVAAASRRCRRFIELGAMRLELGSAESLPYPDGFFDLIYTVNTVYFWPDLDQGMAEIARALKPGGRFLNLFYTAKRLDLLPFTSSGFMKYTAEELAGAASRAGLTPAACAIQPGLSLKINAKKP